MNDKDRQFMSRAIFLAKKGKFTTSPNPNVGCVIVQNNRIVGESYHSKTGESHAEVLAMKKAGNFLKGATVYVTLEPCNHYGLTPPCVDELINAKISKIFVSMTDPNPKVSGKSLIKLKKSGVQVISGLLKDESEKINLGFIKRMKQGLPYITIKMATSIDSKVIPINFEKNKWISSYKSRQDVQEIRAQSSAVLTTGSTIVSDDSRLNVRWNDFSDELKNIYPEKEIRQPVRIVIDTKNKVHENHKIVNIPGECWLFRSQFSKKRWKKNVKEFSTKLDSEGRIDLIYTMKQIAQRKINSILIESGPTFVSSLLSLNLFDQIILYIAPKFFGNQSKELIIISKESEINNISKLRFVQIKKIGEDVRVVLKKKES
ncbi:bifunctional diaminohydroxyphosphoribosylaminopyrimidine deaminase/5-amino-6-(5-phosphoribosylamino)uracil reductase RibD [Candidatus Riesia pediculicola]|uniref:bifunctional diaminohydroxyphosphoribosylaminopyrimidine deaminase/5-amino-6-(5-phosphoribosylamino)uracil reductase RibD n=1 Tax=Candidatus Riesia pediculicola TaxID=401619 RepID=UPI0009C26163|nr:bifunctional diaminohydroxyphosphoribosylaminopyrimidine deaminase/5-amino-6-(5-phosphoribosylamino)uracil reductase RibD [Candidatus Riesia pediculicola]ARC54155.1 5-amino-6-(5-phosphoribosylamino)uracil reductase [Candidatus Riesia pediculicola]